MLAVRLKNREYCDLTCTMVAITMNLSLAKFDGDRDDCRLHSVDMGIRGKQCSLDMGLVS